MTVLQKRAASGIETKGLRVYVVAGIVAVAVGVGSAWGYTQLTQGATVPSVVDVRAAAIGEHLEGVWQSGLAQKKAMAAAHVLQGRVEAGLAQQKAITEAHVLQGRVEAGLAQQKAITETHILQGRVEAGLAQQEAILSANAAKEAMEMRGAAMADHLDGLIESGLATMAAIKG